MIRKAREHLKLSSDDLAAELGITNDQLLRMEFGELRPTPYQLLSLCAVLRVQPSWFFPELSAPVEPNEAPSPAPEKPAPPPTPTVGPGGKRGGRDPDEQRAD